MKTCLSFVSLAISMFFFPLFGQSPVLVADLKPGAAHAFDEFNYRGIQWGDNYILPADNGTLGQELYFFNNVNFNLLKDINVGLVGSNPTSFVAFNDKVYFVANDGTHGNEIWSTTGTTASTQLAIDVVAGPGSSNPKKLTTDASGFLYFSSGGSCYVTDGLSSSASVVSGPSNVDFSDEFNFASDRVCRFEDGIAFIVFNSSDKKYEIWKVKGTSATKLFTQVTNSSFTKLYGLAPVTNGLVFGLYDSFNSSLDGLYSYDKGTQMATRLTAPGPGITRILEFTSAQAVVLSSSGFWATDGSVAGTYNLSSQPLNVYQGQTVPYAVYGDKMIFWGGSGSFSETLKVTDGTMSGTTSVNVTQEPFLSPIINYLENAWYAVGISNGFTAELWHTDINSGVSTKVYTFPSGSSSIWPLILINRQLYFIGNVNGFGRELYRIVLSQSTGLPGDVPSAAPYTLKSLGAASYVIESQDDSERLNLRVFTASGQVVENMELMSGAGFNLPFSSGFYFLELTGKRGTAVFKIVLHQ